MLQKKIQDYYWIISRMTIIFLRTIADLLVERELYFFKINTDLLVEGQYGYQLL